jgi:hypothetical protein
VRAGLRRLGGWLVFRGVLRRVKLEIEPEQDGQDTEDDEQYDGSANARRSCFCSTSTLFRMSTSANQDVANAYTPTQAARFQVRSQ